VQKSPTKDFRKSASFSLCLRQHLFIASSEISDTTFSTYENETFVGSACDENSVASSSTESEEAVNFIDMMDFISHGDDDLDDFGNM